MHGNSRSKRTLLDGVIAEGSRKQSEPRDRARGAADGMPANAVLPLYTTECVRFRDILDRPSTSFYDSFINVGLFLLHKSSPCTRQFLTASKSSLASEADRTDRYSAGAVKTKYEAFQRKDATQHQQHRVCK